MKATRLNKHTDAIYLATIGLENDLLNRIRGSVKEMNQPGATAALPNVMQSDIVSDFSNLALEEWHQRQKYVDTAKAEQTKNWTKLQLK